MKGCKDFNQHVKEFIEEREVVQYDILYGEFDDSDAMTLLV